VKQRLVVDPIKCSAHGMCAELFPEWIELDDWGYPIVRTESVPPHLRAHAEQAVRACPAIALRLVSVPLEEAVPLPRREPRDRS
jgi:ferredoxin